MGIANTHARFPVGYVHTTAIPVLASAYFVVNLPFNIRKKC